MRIVMIGSGYVGLVSGACFAELGHDVTCVDNDDAKIQALECGQVPIFEPGLTELIAAGVAQKRLRFTRDLAGALAGAQAAFIAVGTPARAEDGQADLSYVHRAAREVAAVADAGLILVTKSTVPVGTGDGIEQIVAAVGRADEIHVASNPEFLKEGDAIDDFMSPDRIVLGGSARAMDVLSKAYGPLATRGALLLTMSRRSAELTKYAANALLATRITFINEMADLCEAAGIDVADVARGVGSDRRIGPRFLNAGPGYGGSCFPKDTLALIATARNLGAPQQLVESVVAVNGRRKQAMGRKIVAAVGSPDGKVVAVLGLTFKAGTDDIRDSPAIAVIAQLRDAGVTVRAFDPEGMAHARETFPDMAFCSDEYDAAAGADCLVIATEWPRFAELDLYRLERCMRAPLIADLRNLYDPEHLSAFGFDSVGVGRPDRVRDGASQPTQLEKATQELA